MATPHAGVFSAAKDERNEILQSQDLSTVNTLETPQYQAFNATLRLQEYASGGTSRWQGIFYVVLATVFVVNIHILAYFIHRGQLVTDFIEPQNLFSLSINSPPSAVLDGNCGGGPE
ncbi:MAG: hypothetical protein Q9164_005545 [Protoblastenia rupestris]